MKAEDLKLLVKEKYSEIALQSKTANSSSCCGSTGCCPEPGYTVFSENYERLDGYNPDADLGLGCGIPTEFAEIRRGDVVIDLGSGAGNDCFVARALTGEQGRVIGIDFTEKMIGKALENLSKLGYDNVEFRHGDIEDIPVDDHTADVVISNCVLNLVPDKGKAFKEIKRVLKPGGHLCVSDIMVSGELPSGIRQAASMYAGCISGALELEKYIALMEEAGLIHPRVLKEKKITLPEEILEPYLDRDEINKFRDSGTGIFSLTIYAEKPL